MKKISLTLVLVLFICGCQSDKIEIIPDGDIIFAVYGIDGEVIIDDTGVKYIKNLSVADLSRGVCRELKIPIVFSGAGDLTYLKGINNLFEFDRGALSGWIYFVNGESQSMGSQSYIVQNGDRVEWRYTLDLGKDLGAYFDE